MATRARACGRPLGRVVRLLAAGLAVLLGVTMLAGCSAPTTVRAEGRGVVGDAPFANAMLGRDLAIGGVAALPGGVRSGNTPGLYGGSRKQASCLKGKLIAFLQDPKNRRKAKAWAKVQNVQLAQIGRFIEELTPVVLRNPTLVKNHNYRKGRALAYEALLEAGIAVLVDRFGQPVVKCNCGNPLAAPDHDIDEVKVDFGKGKKKTWKGRYDKGKVVVVKPSPAKTGLKQVSLVDVNAPEKGIERPVGSDGEGDVALPQAPDPAPEGEQVTVPNVVGRPVDEAVSALKDSGLAVERVEERAEGTQPGSVIGQDPAAGTSVDQGAKVILRVAAGKPEPSTGSQGPTAGPGSQDPGGDDQRVTSGSDTEGTTDGSGAEGTTDGSGATPGDTGGDDGSTEDVTGT